MDFNQKITFADTVFAQEVDGEVLQRDLSDFVEKLLESGLVRVVKS